MRKLNVALSGFAVAVVMSLCGTAFADFISPASGYPASSWSWGTYTSSFGNICYTNSATSDAYWYIPLPLPATGVSIHAGAELITNFAVYPNLSSYSAAKLYSVNPNGTQYDVTGWASLTGGTGWVEMTSGGTKYVPTDGTAFIYVQFHTSSTAPSNTVCVYSAGSWQ